MRRSTRSSPPTSTASAPPTRSWGGPWPGSPATGTRLIGAVGHDFYDGERQGAKGFPRFTDPALRGHERLRRLPAPRHRAQPRPLRRRPLRRAAAAQPRPHRLLVRDRLVGDGATCGRRAWPARSASRPGPANGFTLDLIGCLERFGDRIDWAMIIASPFEPWPARLVLPALERSGVRAIARVVDHGGVFHGDVPDETELPREDHRSFRPAGWVQHGRERLEPAAADRRAPRPQHAAARLPVDAGPASGGLRRADPHPGGRRGRPADRGQACRPGRRPPRDPS